MKPGTSIRSGWGGRARRVATLALLAMFALLALPLAQATTTAAGQASRAAAPDFAAIDAYVTTQMKDARIPGLALGIVQGDQIVHLKGFGVADPSGRAVTPQTPFSIGSTAKAVTALATMQLVEQGKLALDAPVQRYLPWFRVADADASARITVRHLLNHTSGLPEAAGNEYAATDDQSAAALERRVRALHTWQLNRPVGTRYEYCNANYDTLGLIVQTVAGQSYEAYVQQYIFAPLQMRQSFTAAVDALPHGLATGYRSWFGIPRPYDAPYPRAHMPSGYIISSAEDMAHFLIGHLNGGRYGRAAVLSPGGIAELLGPAVTTERSGSVHGMAWGPGRWSSVPTVWAGGDNANFKARLLLAPADRWGVVILLNMNSFNINAGRLEIQDGVLSLLLGQPPASGRDTHFMPAFVPFLAIAGVTAVLVLGMLRSVGTLRRWRSRPERGPRGRLGLGLHVVLPLALHLAWALFLLVGVPQTGWSLAFILRHIPDLGWTLVLSAGLALGWGILRTVLVILVLRETGARRVAVAPANV